MGARGHRRYRGRHQPRRPAAHLRAAVLDQARRRHGHWPGDRARDHPGDGWPDLRRERARHRHPVPHRAAARAMNRIAERAGALGLVVTARALADARIDPDSAPRDARLTEPVAGDIKRILGQMARRGSDPELVRALWAKLDGRPLERALVAIDVLAQALWPPRDP